MKAVITRSKKFLSKQNYSAPKVIEGVKVLELKRFTGTDGSFNEVIRIEEGKIVFPEELKGFRVRQINHGKLTPQSIKAWHCHESQNEIWFIHPESKIIAGLLDIREKSKTKRVSMKLSLGDGRAHLVYIPKGVAHGLSNPYLKEATMTYLVDNWFSGRDEWRLPYDFIVGKDFWEIEKD